MDRKRRTKDSGLAASYIVERRVMRSIGVCLGFGYGMALLDVC